jgi:uncharacterized protein with PIN domain
MNQASFRFYAGLNDFLPMKRRQFTFSHSFDGHPSIKDTIEALGVPHTEIDVILVNGESVDFSYLMRDGDQVSVYPPFEHIDIGQPVRIRPDPPAEARFVLDVHLGRLASYLRMLGFDTLYRNDYDDPELAQISRDEERILLTRDRGLLKRSMVRHGYSVRSTNPRQQLVEIVERYNLFDAINPFRRCARCNGLLEPIAREDIGDRLPADMRDYHDEFKICGSCGQLYWRGTHTARMEQLIEHVRAQKPGTESGG